MNRIFSNLTLFALMVFAISALPAFAQEEGTLKLHVSEATAVPGQVLVPGDYKLSLVESAGGARQVKLLDADGRFLRVIPIYRASRVRSIGGSLVRTVAAGSSLSRIDSFYFPAAEDGFQFIYSKSDLQKGETMAQQMRKAGSASGQ
jgi:hypothetical protein